MFRAHSYFDCSYKAIAYCSLAIGHLLSHNAISSSRKTSIRKFRIGSGCEKWADKCLKACPIVLSHPTNPMIASFHELNICLAAKLKGRM